MTLSPFEVVSDTKGYYSANTMSGTRFNSKLEDLGASISVVTREQMSDFAMLDINDIFQYTAGTEGTGTYTDFQVNRNGDTTDNVQASPTTANRIRGLSNANVSFNNYEVSGRMPIDPSITNGVEISRGPNANVFGLGQPGGTVNQIPLTPNLTRNRNETEARVDSYGGWRTGLDFNRVIVNGQLAFRGSAVYQHDGFVRKPSGVNTERYNGTLKFQPFKNTTITVGGYYFHQYGTRANFTNPRDSVTYWEQQGSPTWDPIDEVVHVNGRTLGPFTSDTQVTNAMDALQRTFTGSGHSYLYIDRNGIGYWSAPNTFGPSRGLTNPTTTNQSVRLFASNSFAGASLGKVGNQPLFITTPSVNNKALYDWTKYNLAAMNYDWDTDMMSNVQVDQVFFSTPTQMLAGQVGFFREDAQRYRRDHFGVANDNGQSGQLLVDVNERNLDGTPNPYFGRLYIGQDQPRTYLQPLKWDSYRAQLAYKLDLTQQKGWVKWLGLHQLSGYDEYKYRIQRRYSYREAILDDHSWIPSGISRGNQGAISGGPSAALAVTRSYLRYYVSDPGTMSVNYAPGELQFGSYPFVWGTYTMANRSVNGSTALLPTPGSGVFQQESAQLGLAAVTDSTGAGSNTKTILKTSGAVLQSHFFDDRLVTTFGRREDKQYTKTGSSPQQLIYPQGIAFNYDSIDHWAGGDYNYNAGITTQAGAVVRPLQNWPFVRQMSQGTGLSRLLGDAMNGLFVTYNRSNSFLPQNPAVSLYFQQLPNTTADDKDFGAGLNLFDGKFVIRWNRYHTIVHNYRQGDASTIAQRVTRIDVASNARFLLYTQMYSTTATPAADTTSTAIGWVYSVPGITPTTVQAAQDEVAKEMGLPWSTITQLQANFSAGTIASTQDKIAVGNEVEAHWNPSPNLTVAGNFWQSKEINANISNDISTWIAQRMAVWTTVRDQRDGALWWTKSYGGSQTAQQNFVSFVQTPYNVVKQQEGKADPQTRQYHWSLSTNYRLAGITDNRWLKNATVGGALRWESQGAIGYWGIQDANGIYTSLNTDAPIYDKSHLYVDLIASYRMKLWGDRINAILRLKVENVQENGRLQAISAYPNGQANAYRIVDPRRFILTTTFDF
ncbi:MAG TPA: TonB-dependent receptor plug domain-containing protein [Opitutaceae bacterium]|nr:TonB-dependent receptor plug domain-containing protein [Opitutaceae bacterium]